MITTSPARLALLEIKMHDDLPALPPTRLRHRGDKIDQRGRVSALCFPVPRAIDLRRATWVMNDAGVTCLKCKTLIQKRVDAAVDTPPPGDKEKTP